MQNFNNIKCNLCENAKLNHKKCNIPITKMQSAEMHEQLHKCVLHFYIYNIAFFVPHGSTWLDVR